MNKARIAWFLEERVPDVIAGKTNRQISDKPPRTYFPVIAEKSRDAPFESQCIPMDETLLGVEDYKTFLAARRKLIATRLNEFLGNHDAVQA